MYLPRVLFFSGGKRAMFTRFNDPLRLMGVLYPRFQVCVVH